MTDSLPRKRIVIVGAAGRDFHNFNVVYRDDPRVEVVAFTATQIPGISGRHYPPELAGARYPGGIPIASEEQLEHLCRQHTIDEVVFAYSDVSHEQVMHVASRALAAGASFVLLGPRQTMLASQRPVVAVSAVRTGCGKSQTARWLSRRLADHGLRAGVLRHPMPYGDLARQAVQRFASRDDLDKARCTNEEREEYEPHLAAGNVVYAGVDYAEVLGRAEQDADIIVWDGGNNDFPFVRPDLHIVIVDALRPDQVATHHPGETVARMADVVVINKTRSASSAGVQRAVEALRGVNPHAAVVMAASPVTLDTPERVRDRAVLVIEDGPTITHGGMAYGAGYVASVEAGAREIIDPREHAVGRITELYTRYPHIGRVLPAVGYADEELEALRRTIEASRAEIVVSATPMDLAALIDVSIPVVRVRYAFADADDGGPTLAQHLDDFVARLARA